MGMERDNRYDRKTRVHVAASVFVSYVNECGGNSARGTREIKRGSRK